MLVFRKNLYLQSDDIEDKSDVWKELCNTWIVHCDGKTKDELEAEGYVILDEWCEEVPPGHNPWRTFDELPPIGVQVLIKNTINGFSEYSVGEFDDGMIVFSDDNWRIEDAIDAALKWKYIEDDEEEKQYEG